MADQRNQQNQPGGQRDRQGGGRQKPGQRQQDQQQKPGDSGKQQEQVDKNWREMAEPSQETGTGDPGT